MYLQTFVYLFYLLTQLHSDERCPYDRRYHGERCYVTLVDIRKTLVRPSCSKEERMDDNFQLGDTGAVKNVSDQFESQRMRMEIT